MKIFEILCTTLMTLAFMTLAFLLVMGFAITKDMNNQYEIRNMEIENGCVERSVK